MNVAESDHAALMANAKRLVEIHLIAPTQAHADCKVRWGHDELRGKGAKRTAVNAVRESALYIVKSTVAARSEQGAFVSRAGIVRNRMDALNMVAEKRARLKKGFPEIAVLQVIARVADQIRAGR